MKSIKIQSIGDLITNSSTEVFTVIDNGLVNTIKEVVSTIAGPDLLNRFEILLDPCEQIEDNIDNIIEIMEELDIPVDIEETEESSYSSANDFARRIIATVIDQDTINRHYNLVNYQTGEVKPFCYKKWNDSESKYEDGPVVDPLDPEVAVKVKDDIFKWLEDANENNDWKNYPNLVCIPKDKDNKEDMKIAKAIERLPFLADHEASYC